MKQMLLIFSHELTNEQIKDAQKNFGVNAFIYLPKDLKEKWINIPPNLRTLKSYLEPFIKWINSHCSRHDYILIQGESGSVYYLTRYAFESNLIPVYATTKRITDEIKKDDEVITKRIFKHVLFRKYENYK